MVAQSVEADASVEQGGATRRRRRIITSLSQLDVLNLLRIFWMRRLVVGICVAAALVLGIVYLNFAPRTYTIELEIGPVQATGGGIGSKLGGLGDLASLAGVNIPQDGDSMQYRLYLEGIHSRMVADGLAKRTDIMKRLFSNEWDEDTHSWKQPEGGAVTGVVDFVRGAMGSKIVAWEPPNGARVQKYLDAQVALVKDNKSPLAKIVYNSTDPQFGVALLQALHDVDDGLLRQKAIARSQQYITYLSERLPSIQNAEHRQAIAEVLSDQEKSMMMASARAAFAAEPFGAPNASYGPTSPRAMTVLLVFLVMGLLIGLVYAFLEAIWGLLPWSLFRAP